MTKKDLEEYIWMKKNREYIDGRLNQLKKDYKHRQDPRVREAIKQLAAVYEQEKKRLDEMMKTIVDALNSLPEPEKQIMKLKYIENYVWFDIEMEVYLSLAMIHRYKNRALERIEAANRA